MARWIDPNPDIADEPAPRRPGRLAELGGEAIEPFAARTFA